MMECDSPQSKTIKPEIKVLCGEDKDGNIITESHESFENGENIDREYEGDYTRIKTEVEISSTDGSPGGEIINKQDGEEINQEPLQLDVLKNDLLFSVEKLENRSEGCSNASRSSSRLKCEQCDKTFKTKETYKRHLVFHNAERKFVCDKCGKKFMWKHKYDQHIRIHTGEKPFSCQVCDMKFTQKRGMVRHLKKHSDEEIEATNKKDPKVQTCEICGKEFEDVKRMEIHKRKHAGLKPYVCEICHKEFEQRSNYNTHLETHSDEKRHKCPICDRGFHSSTNLQSHIHTHTGARPFFCDFCGRGFGQSSTLRMHLRTHTGYKPFSCQFCDKTFTRNDQLKKHLRSHTGDKPYICETCGKKFKRDDTLRKHKLLHTGEKPYKCEYCEKEFRQRTGLTCHIKVIHTGDLPWVCQVCGKGYLRKNLLDAHEKKHNLDERIQHSLIESADETFVKDRNLHENNFSNEENDSVCDDSAWENQKEKTVTKNNYNSGIKTISDEYFSDDVNDYIKDLVNSQMNHEHTYCEKDDERIAEDNSIQKTNLESEVENKTRNNTNKKTLMSDANKMKFESPTDLNKHDQGNSRQSEYSCKICQKNFSRKISLQNHVTRVHTGVDYKFNSSRYLYTDPY